MNELSHNDSGIAIAKKIMELTRTSASFKMKFLSNAITYLRTQESTYHLAVDGRYIYYEPTFVIEMYRKDAAYLDYALLHMTVHCLFQHLFVTNNVVPKYWDMACDIYTFHLLSLADDQSIFHSDKAKLQLELKVLTEIKADIDTLTPKSIMTWLTEHKSKCDEYYARSLFIVDDHSLWYPSAGDSSESNEPQNQNKQSKQSNQDEQTKQSPNPSETSGPSDKQNDSQEHNQSSNSQSRAELQNIWKDMAQRAQTGIETGLIPGKNKGDLAEELQNITQTKISYRDFLHKFSIISEQIELNLDEFDYSFYTYGLQLYNNVPLIEPLEYKDTKRIHDFVIAIDTSGSTYYNLVKDFLTVTYNLLTAENTLDSRICIHIIQCDTSIQKDVCIKSMDELERYMYRLRIHGGGGTDFRPVFDYVNSLVEKGEFTDLRGLLYFTDGYGTYPTVMPDYNVAFVFLENKHCPLKMVPSWAIPIVITNEELKELSV